MEPANLIWISTITTRASNFTKSRPAALFIGPKTEKQKAKQNSLKQKIMQILSVSENMCKSKNILDGKMHLNLTTIRISKPSAKIGTFAIWLCLFFIEFVGFMCVQMRQRERERERDRERERLREKCVPEARKWEF